MKEKVLFSVVIVAAGNSSRMGKGIDKQFIKIVDKPVISYSIEAFENSCFIDEIILVCKTEHICFMENIVKESNFRKVKAIVSGGKTRQESVFNGIKEVCNESRYVMIHDGARAMITTDKINEAIMEVKKYDALALAVPAKDTIKKVDGENFVIETPERSKLWSVQTPQIFNKDLYIKAMNYAKINKLDYTDDCQLIENIGVKVKLLMGSYDNIKITTPEDVSIARSIIENRGNES